MPSSTADRRQPTGDYKKTCPHCGNEFFTDNPRVVYDTEKCQKTAWNKRYYEQHRDILLPRAIERKRRKK